MDDAASAQDRIIEWLGREFSARPRFKRIDTQGAIVWLAGDHAFKLRRALRLPFLDYSTLNKRREATFAELSLNRDAAPNVYLGALAVVRDGDGFRLDGSETAGVVVDWLTHMRRFDEEATLDRLAERGELANSMISRLALAIHAAHAKAARREAAPALASLADWIEQNAVAFAEHPDLFPPERAAEITARSRAAWQAVRPLLLARGARGFTRRCHGDLHLRNIAVIDGEPTPFDAIEFDDSIATGDVLYDLAFTAMDLWERDLPRLANTLVNTYLMQDDEAHYAGLAATPLFLSVRAAIRAKVEAANRPHVAGSAREKLEAAARRYFDFADLFLQPTAARLVAVGGLSGTGKSALARELAAEIGRPPGAVWLSTDIERKHMLGVAETERLPPSAYAPEISGQVYARLWRKAQAALAAGQSALVDGVHGRAVDRLASAEIARAAGVAFVGFWLEAPLELRLARAAARRFDPSDADARVIAAQQADPLAEPGWVALSAAGSLSETAAAARAAL